MQSEMERLIFPFEVKASEGIFKVDLACIHQAREIFYLGKWMINLDFLTFDDVLPSEKLLEIISPQIKSEVGSGLKGVYPTLDNLSVCLVKGDGTSKSFIFTNGSTSKSYSRAISFKRNELILELRSALEEKRPIFKTLGATLRGYIWIPL